MREWYFDGGGIVLSARARKIYGKAQDSIGTLLDRRGWDSPTALDRGDYETVRRALSRLRTELTRDLQSRVAELEAEVERLKLQAPVEDEDFAPAPEQAPAAVPPNVFNATDLKMSIHPHPTLSETVMESAETFFGHATHIYRPKRK